jgi:hypothetical protein
MTSRRLSTARAPPALAVADEACGFVVPFAVQEIDGVLQCARSSVVVFRRDEDVAVEGVDLGGPSLGVRLRVLSHRRRDWLIEQRQVEIFDVDELELSVGPFLRELEDPAGNSLANASRTSAADNDC